MTHPAAELLRAIADGNQMEYQYPDDGWRICNAGVALYKIYVGEEHKIRIARPMVTRQVTYPEPLRELPEAGKTAWCVSPEYKVVQAITTREMMKRFFDHGMAFATEGDAAEAHKALFGSNT